MTTFPAGTIRLSHDAINIGKLFLAVSLLTTTPLSPYKLGKDGFGADQTHEGDIAQHSKELLKARFGKNVDS